MTFPKLHLAPFTVAVDSNEAAHGWDYRFEELPSTRRNAEKGKLILVPRVVKFLNGRGDYSIEGMESRVAVERKTLEDLYGTLGAGRERFSREFERLAEMEHAAVVIEADWREIVRPTDFRADWKSRVDPKGIWGTLFSWSQRFPSIHWWTMGSRRLAELATFEILERFWREDAEK